MFLRGMPELCLRMKRPMRGSLAPFDGEHPDFYKISLYSPLPDPILEGQQNSKHKGLKERQGEDHNEVRSLPAKQPITSEVTVFTSQSKRKNGPKPDRFLDRVIQLLPSPPKRHSMPMISSGYDVSFAPPAVQSIQGLPATLASVSESQNPLLTGGCPAANIPFVGVSLSRSSSLGSFGDSLAEPGWTGTLGQEKKLNPSIPQGPDGPAASKPGKRDKTLHNGRLGAPRRKKSRTKGIPKEVTVDLSGLSVADLLYLTRTPSTPDR
jgi:hypothetical protein